MDEIERKYRVKYEIFPRTDNQIVMKQGYLSVDPSRVVRVRIEGSKAWLTIKGKMTGITRSEYEYDIPVAEAEQILRLTLNQPVEKVRHKIVYEGTKWEVDEFLGTNKGLWLAEVELLREDQEFSLPPWLGEEVTGDYRYYNSSLSRHPFMLW
jgi:adenylate cyclase